MVINTSKGLSNQQIEYQKSYCKKVSTRYEYYTEESLKIVFTPYFQPDVWEDAAKVYQKMLLDFLPLDKNEIPVLFAGATVQKRFTKIEQAIGFLFTDHNIYVREISMYSEYLPKFFPYPKSKNDAVEVLGQAVQSFDWSYLDRILALETKSEIIQFMIGVVSDILTVKEEHNIEHFKYPKSKDLTGRIAEIGLCYNSCVKIPSEKNLRSFRKIKKKYEIPFTESIQLAIIDTTIIGSYGLVITDQSVYSKTISGEVEKDDLNDLVELFPVKIVEDSIVLGLNITHTLPSSLSKSEKESVKIIMQELINGEITL